MAHRERRGVGPARAASAEFGWRFARPPAHGGAPQVVRCRDATVVTIEPLEGNPELNVAIGKTLSKTWAHRVNFGLKNYFENMGPYGAFLVSRNEMPAARLPAPAARAGGRMGEGTLSKEQGVHPPRERPPRDAMTMPERVALKGCARYAARAGGRAPRRPCRSHDAPRANAAPRAGAAPSLGYSTPPQPAFPPLDATARRADGRRDRRRDAGGASISEGLNQSSGYSF